MALETPRYPLDKNQLGNASWKVLHSYAAQYPDNPNREDKQEFHSLLKAVVRTIPEGDCKCKTHAIDYIQKKNPKMGNRNDLVTWLCEFHNDVNKRSGKTELDCNQLLQNTGDCPSCKVKPKEKAIIAADIDGPLKTVMADYKKNSIKVFEELCHREGLPVPKIVFAACPPPNDNTSCTTFVVTKDEAVVKDAKGDGREPVVYINPNNFGLRVLIHEWHEYQRQMKAKGHYMPHDEKTVENNTQNIIQKYFPRDYYSPEKTALIEQSIVMKDETMAVQEVKEENPKPYSFRNRSNYKSSFSTDEFPMFSKYKEKQKQAEMDSIEASKADSGGMLSYFDAFYEPIGKMMSLPTRDVNLSNTTNIFTQGSRIALDSQFTTFGSLVATSVIGIGLFLATILNKDGIGIADRRLLSYLGSNFLWSGLEAATSPAVKETASMVGSYLANMEFDKITKLMVNDNSIFAGITEAQAQQQAGVQRRAQQRAATGGGIAGGRGNVRTGGPAVSPAQSVIERVQERALNPEGNQPENIKMFKNFPSPAAGGAVPRTDSGGGRGFTYVPTPASPYDMPQDEIDYNAMLGIPTEPTEWLPTRNLGMTLSEDELEELR